MNDNPEPVSFRFLAVEHIRRKRDFDRTFARRRSVSDTWLIVYGCENGLPYTRLGLSVSRKVGPAVVRNRLRRLYREAFRLSKHEMPTGVDLVLIPRRSDEPTLEQLKQGLSRLVRAVAKKLEASPLPASAREEGRDMIARAWGLMRMLLVAFLISGVRLYQVAVRPLLPPLCRFQPSCSEYMIEAVNKYGPVCGACRGVWRICRCNPVDARRI